MTPLHFGAVFVLIRAFIVEWVNSEVAGGRLKTMVRVQPLFPFPHFNHCTLPCTFTEQPSEVSEVSYECCQTPYSRITFTLHLRRKPRYYVLNLIVPCLLFSVLTTVTFLLQPGCSERLGLGKHPRCLAGVVE